MPDRLTSTKKKELQATGKEIPPTPKPLTDSNEDEDDQVESQATHGEDNNNGKGKEVAEVAEVAEPSNKGKEVANPAGDEHIEVTSFEIFAGYESIGKVYTPCNSLGILCNFDFP